MSLPNRVERGKLLWPEEWIDDKNLLGRKSGNPFLDQEEREIQKAEKDSLEKRSDGNFLRSINNQRIQIERNRSINVPAAEFKAVILPLCGAVVLRSLLGESVDTWRSKL